MENIWKFDKFANDCKIFSLQRVDKAILRSISRIRTKHAVSQIIFEQKVPLIRVERIFAVDGSSLLVLSVEHVERLLERCLSLALRRLSGWRRAGLLSVLIAVLLLICGFRLGIPAVWMDFIIRICVVILIRERGLDVVSRAAAGADHPLVIISRVVGFICEIRRGLLLGTNWI